MSFPAPFQLTEAQIARKGLTAEEMTAFCGIPLFILPLDSLPGWSALEQKRRFTLSQKEARKNKMWAFYRRHGLWDERNRATIKAELSSDSTESLPYLYAPLYDRGFLRREDRVPSLFLEKKEAAQAILTPALGDPLGLSQTRRFVLLQKESLRDLFCAPRHAVYHSLSTYTPDLFCSLFLCQPPSKIKRLPDLGWYKVVTDLHEMAHALPLEPARGSQDSFVERTWLSEVYASFFAFSAIRETQEGAAALPSLMHENYWDFLSSDDTHQIAPALQALIKGEPPPSRQDISLARSEILLHLDAPTDRTTHEDLRHVWQEGVNPTTLPLLLTQSEKNLKETFYDCADIHMTYLDWIVGEHMLASPLAQTTAQKILEAARFFNPAFCSAPLSLPKRTHQVGQALHRAPAAQQP